MRRPAGIFAMVTALMFLGVCACDTYTMMPTRTRSAPPAPEAGPPPSGGTPSPYLSEQVRQLESRVQNLESRLAELEQARGPAAAPAVEETGRPSAAAPPVPSTAQYPPPSPADDKAFSEGMRLYREKKYDAARNRFYQYLKNQRGPKAPEARYYLADSFYQEKRYREAAVEFNKVVNLHPKNVLAPSALLRQALSYEQLQQKENYRIALKKLVKDYPNSPEAREARKRLNQTAR